MFTILYVEILIKCVLAKGAGHVMDDVCVLFPDQLHFSTVSAPGRVGTAYKRDWCPGDDRCAMVRFLRFCFSANSYGYLHRVTYYCVNDLGGTPYLLTKNTLTK